MKKVLLIIGSISIGYGIYMLFKGKSFSEEMPLFINGIILFGSAFIKDKNKDCKFQSDKK